jgi:hypothetical protein
MIDTCPIYPDSSTHKLRAYLQKLGSLCPSDHQSMNDKLNCGLDASPRKHVAAPRNDQQTGVLSQK